MSEMQIIHISCAKIYRVGGVTFEWHNYLGPRILNRHTEEERNYRNISLRNWAMVWKFNNMTAVEREQYRLV